MKPWASAKRPCGSVEGLIRLIPNRGAFVTKPEFEEIAEMFDVMSLLEGFCASRACQKMTANDFSRLEKLHGKLEENFEQRNQEENIRVNNLYHSFVQEIAGNRTLNQMVDGLRKKILLYRFQSLNHPDRFASSIHEHRELLNAFRRRDDSEAETLMRQHMKNQTQALEKLVEQSNAES